MSKQLNSLVMLGVITLGTVHLKSEVATAAFLPVCDRTPQVKANLESQVRKACADIVEEDLLKITRVAVGNGTIQNFKADDFTGLRNLEILNIRSSKYTQLPEGLFNDLGNLKTLVIISTTLRNYPDDFLAAIPLLENLHAFRNQVRSMSESVLIRLATMNHLKVIDFDRSLQEAEKTRLRLIFPENGSTQLVFR